MQSITRTRNHKQQPPVAENRQGSQTPLPNFKFLERDGKEVRRRKGREKGEREENESQKGGEQNWGQTREERRGQ